MRKRILGVVVSSFLALSGCSSSTDLAPEARCTDGVIASPRNAKAILELAPSGIERIESRFDESDRNGYKASCVVSEGPGREAVAVAFEANFIPNASPPSRTSLRTLASSLPDAKGLVRVTAGPRQVGGVSSRDGALLRASCNLTKSKTLPPDLREGAMKASAWAPNASDAGSVEQRRRLTDLALAFLRHAVQKCDEIPTLPKSMHILS